MNETKTDTFCGKCGTPIYHDAPSGDPKKRNPCPNCGSTVRKFSLEISAHVAVSAMVKADVTTYPQALLVAAKDLIASGQPSISVVVSHMACEVAAERALSRAFSKRGIKYLEKPVYDLLSSCNLANDRTRRLYTALTGDKVHDLDQWKAFKESSKRRNRIVHRGSTATENEAKESADAAAALVKHLENLGADDSA